jgi:hypothetical protein
MKRKSSASRQVSRSLAAFLLVPYALAFAQAEPAPIKAPPAASQPRTFDPPPVPQFMLRKPERPLTQEEMQREADEAAARARKAAAPRTAAPDFPLPPSPGSVK